MPCNARFGPSLLAGIVAAVLTASSSSHAVTVNATAAIDLSALVPDTPTNFTRPLTVPASVGVGDTVHFRVTFLNNQALRWTSTAGSSTAFFFLLTDAAHAFSADVNNISVNLLGLSTDGGFVNPASLAPLDDVGIVGIPAIVPLALNAGQFISFTGFDVVFDVPSITSIGSLAPPIVFDSAWILGDGVDGSVVSAPPAIPLPAALPLFATGAGLVALLARRRKTRQAAA